MLTATLSDFRKYIEGYLDKVTGNSEILIINRCKDSGVVIMFLEEYNSLRATLHELASKRNEQCLHAAIKKQKKDFPSQKILLRNEIHLCG